MNRFYSYPLIVRYRFFFDQYPYWNSIIIAGFLTLLLFFVLKEPDLSIDDVVWSEELQFVQVDIQRKKEIKKKKSAPPKKLDKSKFTKTPDEQAWDEAVDLSFAPNNQLPRLLSPLRKLYPQYAKDEQVEAMVLVEILIKKTGIVGQVKVRGVRLFKSQTPEKDTLLKVLFRDAARSMLENARYTKPKVNKKNVSIRLEFPLVFRLED